MSEAKFTRGPWAVAARQGDDWDSVVYLPNTPHLEVCQCFHNPRDTETCTANAHLISAAPDMYEALDTLVAVVGLTAFKHEKQISVLQEAVDAALAALKKARGEA